MCRESECSSKFCVLGKSSIELEPRLSSSYLDRLVQASGEWLKKFSNVVACSVPV